MADGLPRHLAIIMDGNGRWAQARGLPRTDGHRAGAETVREIVRKCRDLGIEFLTLYSFSTENWSRPPDEVLALMRILADYMVTERQEMLDRRIRLNVIGQLDRIPDFAQRLVQDVIRVTSAQQTDMVLNLALSYGGRAEIVRAAQRLCREVKAGRLLPGQVDEVLFASYLDTVGMPDPDFLIRTSGEQRLSNFLLWQVAYTEIYVTDVHWPDFRTPQLLQALDSWKGRSRRFGRLKA